MTKTTNYQLPKWEKTDRIQMKDFNDMTATLDAALKANADTAAAELAISLGAEKLILLTDVRGVLRDPKDNDTLIRQIRLEEVPSLLSSGVIGGGMIPKIQCCVNALEHGVHRTHILDGRIPHSILTEMLSHQGIGTMIWE